MGVRGGLKRGLCDKLELVTGYRTIVAVYTCAAIGHLLLLAGDESAYRFLRCVSQCVNTNVRKS